jgi:hypothetical protein
MKDCEFCPKSFVSVSAHARALKFTEEQLIWCQGHKSFFFIIGGVVQQACVCPLQF